MSNGAWHTFPLAVFLALLVPFRFAAQNLRIPVIPNSVNLFQQQLVFDSFFRDFVFDVTAHCHQQCASAHLANSASPISFNRLFRGVMTPSLTLVRPGHWLLLDGLLWVSLSLSLSLSSFTRQRCLSQDDQPPSGFDSFIACFMAHFLGSKQLEDSIFDFVGTGWLDQSVDWKTAFFQRFSCITVKPKLNKIAHLWRSIIDDLSWFPRQTRKFEFRDLLQEASSTLFYKSKTQHFAHTLEVSGKNKKERGRYWMAHNISHHLVSRRADPCQVNTDRNCGMHQALSASNCLIGAFELNVAQRLHRMARDILATRCLPEGNVWVHVEPRTRGRKKHTWAERNCYTTQGHLEPQTGVLATSFADETQQERRGEERLVVYLSGREFARHEGVDGDPGRKGQGVGGRRHRHICSQEKQQVYLMTLRMTRHPKKKSRAGGSDKANWPWTLRTKMDSHVAQMQGITSCRWKDNANGHEPCAQRWTRAVARRSSMDKTHVVADCQTRQLWMTGTKVMTFRILFGRLGQRRRISVGRVEQRRLARATLRNATQFEVGEDRCTTLTKMITNRTLLFSN